jgi:DNA end-binding protein Ku
MAEDAGRSEDGPGDEGLSTRTKVVAGTALGVAVPAAVAAGRKLIGGGSDEGGDDTGERAGSPSGSRRRRQTGARSGSSTSASSTRSRPSGGSKTRARSSSARTPTREQLYKQAKRLKIEGRSRMTKAQLERAVARAKG